MSPREFVEVKTTYRVSDYTTAEVVRHDGGVSGGIVIRGDGAVIRMNWSDWNTLVAWATGQQAQDQRRRS